MSTSITYKATWNGEDPTMVRCHPLGEKVEVKKGQTVDVEQSVANRLQREPNWEVADKVEVKDMKHVEDKETAQAREKKPAKKSKDAEDKE